jgi:predicted nicotinamide N-methyase
LVLASVSDPSGPAMSSASLPSGYSAEALHAIISSRFDVMFEDVTLGLQTFRLAAVRHPERLLDTITVLAFAEDEQLPYWAELWTSALVLSEKILRGDAMKGKHVLELGCGLGLAGIAAARAGADVTLADYDKDALLFARWNALTNLDAAAAARVRILPLDWREPHTGRYDLILGADIVYERRNFAPLTDFFSAALRPGGCILLAEPDRQIGDDFIAHVRKQGTQVTVERVSTQRRGRASTVRLIALRPEAQP